MPFKHNSEKLFEFDRQYFGPSQSSSPHNVIIGIDEAGRGPLAGPVVAAAVALPIDFFHPDLNDSKRLSPQKRELIFQTLLRDSYWAIGVQSHQVIDQVNILNATHNAMKNALNLWKKRFSANTIETILVDGLHVKSLPTHYAIVGGDRKSAAIAAASVLAKVWRDKMMTCFDLRFPFYGFAQHKGYGSKKHIEALEKYGPCIIHRKTFAPVKNYFEKSFNVTI